MPEVDPAARVAAKFQAVYDGADAEERAVLDEFGAMLQSLVELTETDSQGDVVGFGQPKARRAGTGLEAVKQQFNDAMKDTEGQDKLGNFEIHDLMSNYNGGLTLSSMLGTRWPPG